MPVCQSAQYRRPCIGAAKWNAVVIRYSCFVTMYAPTGCFVCLILLHGSFLIAFQRDCFALTDTEEPDSPSQGFLTLYSKYSVNWHHHFNKGIIIAKDWITKIIRQKEGKKSFFASAYNNTHHCEPFIFRGKPGIHIYRRRKPFVISVQTGAVFIK